MLVVGLTTLLMRTIITYNGDNDIDAVSSSFTRITTRYALRDCRGNNYKEAEVIHALLLRSTRAAGRVGTTRSRHYCPESE